MRKLIAREIVKYVARPLDNAYAARMDGNFHTETTQAAEHMRRERKYLQLAFRIHKQAAGQQCIEEGWWG